MSKLGETLLVVCVIVLTGMYISQHVSCPTTEWGSILFKNLGYCTLK